MPGSIRNDQTSSIYQPSPIESPEVASYTSGQMGLLEQVSKAGNDPAAQFRLTPKNAAVAEALFNAEARKDLPDNFIHQQLSFESQNVRTLIGIIHSDVMNSGDKNDKDNLNKVMQKLTAAGNDTKKEQKVMPELSVLLEKYSEVAFKNLVNTFIGHCVDSFNQNHPKNSIDVTGKNIFTDEIEGCKFTVNDSLARMLKADKSTNRLYHEGIAQCFRQAADSCQAIARTIMSYSASLTPAQTAIVPQNVPTPTQQAPEKTACSPFIENQTPPLSNIFNPTFSPGFSPSFSPSFSPVINIPGDESSKATTLPDPDTFRQIGSSKLSGDQQFAVFQSYLNKFPDSNLLNHIERVKVFTPEPSTATRSDKHASKSAHHENIDHQRTSNPSLSLTSENVEGKDEVDDARNKYVGDPKSKILQKDSAQLEERDISAENDAQLSVVSSNQDPEKRANLFEQSLKFWNGMTATPENKIQKDPAKAQVASSHQKIPQEMEKIDTAQVERIKAEDLRQIIPQRNRAESQSSESGHSAVEPSTVETTEDVRRKSTEQPTSTGRKSGRQTDGTRLKTTWRTVDLMVRPEKNIHTQFFKGTVLTEADLSKIDKKSSESIKQFEETLQSKTALARKESGPSSESVNTFSQKLNFFRDLESGTQS